MKVRNNLKKRRKLPLCIGACLVFSSLIILQQPVNANSQEIKKKPETKSDEIQNLFSEFEMKLNIEHGHIGHVFIGCKEGATDGFDNRIDDMAPPPGMGGVGYTFLVSPDRKYNLYRDIRGLSEKVQWVFYAKVGSKPVTLNWEAKSLPKNLNLFCGKWDGKSEEVQHIIDCREKFSIKRDKTGFFRFWIEPRERDAK